MRRTIGERIKKAADFAFWFLCAGGIMEVYVLGRFMCTFIEEKILIWCISIFFAVFTVAMSYIANIVLFGFAELVEKIIDTRAETADIYDILCEGCGAILSGMRKDKE